MERPAARGSGDWAWDTKMVAHQVVHTSGPVASRAAGPPSPMFVDKSDATRPLLYRVARQCFIDLQAAVGVAEGEHAGLHGLRVATR